MKDSCRNPWCEKPGKLPLGNPEVWPIPRVTPWVIKMGNFAYKACAFPWSLSLSSSLVSPQISSTPTSLESQSTIHLPSPSLSSSYPLSVDWNTEVLATPRVAILGYKFNLQGLVGKQEDRKSLYPWGLCGQNYCTSSELPIAALVPREITLISLF